MRAGAAAQLRKLCDIYRSLRVVINFHDGGRGMGPRNEYTDAFDTRLALTRVAGPRWLFWKQARDGRVIAWKHAVMSA